MKKKKLFLNFPKFDLSKDTIVFLPQYGGLFRSITAILTPDSVLVECGAESDVQYGAETGVKCGAESGVKCGAESGTKCGADFC